MKLHLSPARVRDIQRRPELLRPGAERLEISILFSDIANFSTITGRMDPDALFGLLNRYFEVALGCVHTTQGTVIKLIGDAIFAVWNAPFPQKDHHLHACRTALLLQERLEQLNQQTESPAFHTRIGLHSGTAHVGNVGSSTRFDYTAIGDDVNLASRLEGLNKFLGTRILITRTVHQEVADRVDARYAGRFRLKGLERAVDVYELIDMLGIGAARPAWREVFDRGLKAFQNQEFAGAEAAFSQVMELHPNDGPATFFRERVAEYRGHPPPPGWDGAVELHEK